MKSAFSISIWRSGVVLLLTLWYVFASTQLLFVLADGLMPTVEVEDAAPNCVAMGCGCDVNDPGRICCCTGKTVSEVHGFRVDATVSNLSTTLSYLAASFCAGGFPDQGEGIKSAPLFHLLANAPLLLLTLVFLCFLPLSSCNFSNWKIDPPDKIPILFS
ncbi:MAG: hypothetical protein ACO36I_10485 [Candidatus Latescibacterota bacterium]